MIPDRIAEIMDLDLNVYNWVVSGKSVFDSDFRLSHSSKSIRHVCADNVFELMTGQFAIARRLIFITQRRKDSTRISLRLCVFA